MTQPNPLTCYAGRKQLNLLLDGSIDFLAVRLEKCNPDDVVFITNNAQIPDEVVDLLVKLKERAKDFDEESKISAVINKYVRG